MTRKEQFYDNMRKNIEKHNAEFNALPDNKKRVAVAQDVIDAIDAKVFNAKGGRCIRFATGYNPTALAGDFQLKLMAEMPECSCCAKGALLMAKTIRGNNVTVNESDLIDGDYNDSCYIGGVSQLDCFSREQLDLIEAAFEQTTMYVDCDDDNPLRDTKRLRDASRAYLDDAYEDDDVRLKAICQNIIDNDGEFVF